MNSDFYSIREEDLGLRRFTVDDSYAYARDPIKILKNEEITSNFQASLRITEQFTRYAINYSNLIKKAEAEKRSKKLIEFMIDRRQRTWHIRDLALDNVLVFGGAKARYY